VPTEVCLANAVPTLVRRLESFNPSWGCGDVVEVDECLECLPLDCFVAVVGLALVVEEGRNKEEMEFHVD